MQPESMIDLHCHLLPGIDDGPATLGEALAMARLAVQHGICEARVTPHLHVGRWDNDRARIVPAVQAYRAALHAHGIELRVSFAAEVRASYDVVPLIEEGRVPFLGKVGGASVLLLELPHSHVPVGAERLVEWLLGRGIRPMLAHPERNKDIVRDPRKILPFVRLGCLLQLTADAVAGEFGEDCAACAAKLLAEGWVTVLASDAHDSAARPPRISRGREAAARIVGADEARKLVEDNPRRIVQEA
jgi:protein-tyrosine phosphatase